MRVFDRIFRRGNKEEESAKEEGVRLPGVTENRPYGKEPLELRRASTVTRTGYGAKKVNIWSPRRYQALRKQSRFVQRSDVAPETWPSEMKEGAALRAWKQHRIFMRQSRQLQQNSLTRLDKR